MARSVTNPLRIIMAITTKNEITRPPASCQIFAWSEFEIREVCLDILLEDYTAAW